MEVGLDISPVRELMRPARWPSRRGGGGGGLTRLARPLLFGLAAVLGLARADRLPYTGNEYFGQGWEDPVSKTTKYIALKVGRGWWAGGRRTGWAVRL